MKRQANTPQGTEAARAAEAEALARKDAPKAEPQVNDRHHEQIVSLPDDEADLWDDVPV